MSQKLNQIQEILFLELRPWKCEQYTELKFKQLLNDVKTPSEKTASRYCIDFDKPISFKRQFYIKTIDADATEFLNEIHAGVRRSKTANHRKFYVFNALNKTLKSLLIETSKIITERGLEQSLFKPLNGKVQKGNQSDEAFIFHYLKHQLIRLYLEVSEPYPDYRKTENLELEDLYETYFSEVAPHEAVIQPQVETEVSTIQEPEQQEGHLLPVDSFYYIHLATAPDNLKDLHDNLRQNGFIDHSTTVPQFKRIFSGNEVKNPVVWTGTRSDLYYFISQIHNNKKLVKDMKQNQWKATARCFIQPDGTAFDPTSFRGLKKPATTADKIDKAIQLLF